MFVDGWEDVLIHRMLWWLTMTTAPAGRKNAGDGTGNSFDVLEGRLRHWHGSGGSTQQFHGRVVAGLFMGMGCIDHAGYG